MKLQDQVCSFIQAEQLKTIGVTQSLSYFIYRHWRGNGQIIIDKRKDKYFDYAKGRHMKPYTEIICSAFTVAELGVMLQYVGVYTAVNTVMGGWGVYHVNSYKEYELPQPGNFNNEKHEAHARAHILIHLLENNLVKVEEVNERLA